MEAIAKLAGLGAPGAGSGAALDQVLDQNLVGEKCVEADQLLFGRGGGGRSAEALGNSFRGQLYTVWPPKSVLVPASPPKAGTPAARVYQFAEG